MHAGADLLPGCSRRRRDCPRSGPQPAASRFPRCPPTPPLPAEHTPAQSHVARGDRSEHVSPRPRTTSPARAPRLDGALCPRGKFYPNSLVRSQIYSIEALLLSSAIGKRRASRESVLRLAEVCPFANHYVFPSFFVISLQNQGVRAFVLLPSEKLSHWRSPSS